MSTRILTPEEVATVIKKIEAANEAGLMGFCPEHDRASYELDKTIDALKCPGGILLVALRQLANLLSDYDNGTIDKRLPSHEALRAEVARLEGERDAAMADAQVMRDLRAPYDLGCCGGRGWYSEAQQVGEYPDGSPMVEEAQIQCAGCPDCVGLVMQARDAAVARAEQAEAERDAALRRMTNAEAVTVLAAQSIATLSGEVALKVNEVGESWNTADGRSIFARLAGDIPRLIDARTMRSAATSYLAAAVAAEADAAKWRALVEGVAKAAEARKPRGPAAFSALCPPPQHQATGEQLQDAIDACVKATGGQS